MFASATSWTQRCFLLDVTCSCRSTSTCPKAGFRLDVKSVGTCIISLEKLMHGETGCPLHYDSLQASRHTHYTAWQQCTNPFLEVCAHSAHCSVGCRQILYLNREPALRLATFSRRHHYANGAEGSLIEVCSLTGAWRWHQWSKRQMWVVWRNLIRSFSKKIIRL